MGTEILDGYVSAGGHVVEPADLWTTRMDKRASLAASGTALTDGEAIHGFAEQGGPPVSLESAG